MTFWLFGELQLELQNYENYLLYIFMKRSFDDSIQKSIKNVYLSKKSNLKIKQK